ncbi:hypothetical protein ACP70R_021226 [Stipagrostis hirtigluma subsp. patula]
MSSASVRRNPSRSASTIVADNAGGYHDFKIDGYSRIRELPTGEPLKSGPFTVGGHRWRIAFFPNGYREASEGYVSLYLFLDEDATERVMARFEFAFMAEVRASFFRKRIKKVGPKPPKVNSFTAAVPSSGFQKLISKEELELFSCAIKNDSLTVRCDIVVFNELRPEETKAEAATPTTFVPPSNLHRHLGDLLHTGKGADVVFKVGGEAFPAHRCVLAARSPVFSAELFGAMKESDATTVGAVQVDDIDAQVFKALLCFLYTDSLPEMRKEEEDAMYQHLLVAADRYGVERLKLICEDKLRNYIDVGKVATILTLAEQHQCPVLKKACLDFLSAPANLRAVMASDGFQHLSTSCPSIKQDLIAMLAS